MESPEPQKPRQFGKPKLSTDSSLPQLRKPSLEPRSPSKEPKTTSPDTRESRNRTTLALRLQNDLLKPTKRAYRLFDTENPERENLKIEAHTILKAAPSNMAAADQKTRRKVETKKGLGLRRGSDSQLVNRDLSHTSSLSQLKPTHATAKNTSQSSRMKAERRLMRFAQVTSPDLATDGVISLRVGPNSHFDHFNHFNL